MPARGHTEQMFVLCQKCGRSKGKRYLCQDIFVTNVTVLARGDLSLLKRKK